MGKPKPRTEEVTIMLRELRNNDHGVVFITVLIIIIISIVSTLTILSLNISQVTSSEDEVRHIQAEILSTGGLARIFIEQFSGTPANVIIYAETLDGITYAVVANIDAALGIPPPNSASIPLDIDVTF